MKHDSPIVCLPLRWLLGISLPLLCATGTLPADIRAETVLHDDCGEDTGRHLAHLQVVDGHIVTETVAGRSARRNADPAKHRHMYFAIDDDVTVNGLRPSAEIDITYLDAGQGRLILQYDSSDPAPFPGDIYKLAGTIPLTDSGEWRTHRFRITDTYFGNRQNGGADFRIARPEESHFWIDRVEVRLGQPSPVKKLMPHDVLGATHACGKYSFDSKRDFLGEGMVEIASAGMRVVKLWMNQGDPGGCYPWHSDWPEAPVDLVQIAQHRYYREAWRRPFDTYVLTIVGGRTFRDGLPDPHPAEVERQFHDLALWFMTEYRGTGKTFILGTWESDWQLRGTFDRSPEHDPEQLAIDGMIRWYRARQAGVIRARREIPDADVHVYAAAEVNLVSIAMEGRPTVTNDVLPNLDMDLVSYSCWSSVDQIGVNEETGRQVFRTALAYLADKTPDTDVRDPQGRPFGNRNILITEYGAPEQGSGPAGPARLERITRGTVEVAHDFGCPWIIYWQVYCNECCQPDEDPCVPVGGTRKDARPATANEHCRGFWLKRVDGTFSTAHRYLTRVIGPFIPPPTDFNVTSVGPGKVMLEWTRVATADGYRIERSVRNGPYLLLKETDARTTNLAIGFDNRETPCRYRIRSEKKDTEPSAWFYSPAWREKAIGREN